MTETPPQWDPAIYSNTGRMIFDEGDVDGETGRWQPFTWRELADQQTEKIAALQKFRTMVTDLDRNEHGRHEGDADGSDPCGVSHGNPLIRTGETLGYSLGGSWRYVMPERGRRHDPDAWKVDNQ